MNIAQKITIACCGLMILSACKKNNPEPDEYISFYVNDVYKIIKPEADYFDDDTFLLQAGPDMKGEIGLFLDTIVQIKTYYFENPFDGAVADWYDNSGTHFWSDTGTLVVSAFDGDHISGTFSFKGHAETGKPATVHITEGHFSTDVTYVSFSPDTCTVCDSAYSFSHRATLARRYLRHKQLATKVILR
jgi:hypothetical protein